MLWSKMGRPPLRSAIYQFIERKEYEEELMSGQLFRKLIKEIKENPSEDKTGYYLSDSREQLTYEDLQRLKKEKDSIVKELITNNRVERYYVVLRFCEVYQSWALKKKAKLESSFKKLKINLNLNIDKIIIAIPTEVIIAETKTDNISE